MKYYRVKFWNPKMPGKGFILAYRRAATAKSDAARYNDLYKRDGCGIRAEYLGVQK